GVADVGLDEVGDSLLAEPVEVLHAAAPAQVVDEDDIVSLAMQSRRGMAPDEASPSRDDPLRHRCLDAETPRPSLFESEMSPTPDPHVRVPSSKGRPGAPAPGCGPERGPSPRSNRRPVLAWDCSMISVYRSASFGHPCVSTTYSSAARPIAARA